MKLKFKMLRSFTFSVSRFIYFIFFCFILSLLPDYDIYAQKSIDDQVVKGLNYCYNFEWDRAESIFSEIIKKYPHNPAGYHYLSSIYFWYYISNKQKQHLDSFFINSDKAIERAKELLGKSEDEKMLYLIGSNYSYRAIAFAKAEEFLDAAWATKESESYLSDAIAINPELYDAYLGLGLYNFAIAQIPAAFKWVLSLAGISGNQNEGLKYIRITAEKGKFSKVEANYYLSQIYSEVLYDYKSASANLNSLVKIYPHNTLFIYSLAVLDLKKRNLDKAEIHLNKILNENNVNFKQLISFSNFLMGDVYFRKNNFYDAITYYTKFLSSAHTKDYTGIAAFRLAVCYELSGFRNKAKNYFSASGKGNMDLDDDLYAKRKGAVYHQRSISENETKLIKAANMVEAGNYLEAVDTLTSMLTNLKKEELQAEAKIILSDALFFLNKLDESIKFGKEALEYAGNEETWLKPFALYYLARTHLKKGEMAEAKYYVYEAIDLSGYDYESKLKNLLSALVK